jgi:coenzyme F420-0:L-glutamate ligase/coenzyme F420-1:gamma-L-glutamate ligase
VSLTPADVPPVLTPAERAFLVYARTATLATIDPNGRPRLVPVCFVLAPLDVRGRPVLHTPIDEKPKSTTDPYALARVRDIRERPAVSLLVQRWSENWDELAWLRMTGRAELVEPIPRDVGARAVVRALRTKYSQYADHDLESRPLIMVTIERATSWFASNS